MVLAEALPTLVMESYVERIQVVKQPAIKTIVYILLINSGASINDFSISNLDLDSFAWLKINSF